MRLVRTALHTAKNVTAYPSGVFDLKRTSRERPKSAPYLRLKKIRNPLFLQLETTKALKKLKIEFKEFPKNFFRIFFEVFGKSHSAEKCKRDPLGFFEHPLCCKISKNDGGTEKNFGKNGKFEQSHSAEKWGKVS